MTPKDWINFLDANGIQHSDVILSCVDYIKIESDLIHSNDMRKKTKLRLDVIFGKNGSFRNIYVIEVNEDENNISVGRNNQEDS